MNGAELNTILPYNDPRCRAGLYQLLEKLVLCPSPQWPAPLNYASAVLNNGLNDPNLEVMRDLCFVMYSTKLHIAFSICRYRRDASKPWRRSSRYCDPEGRRLTLRWKWNNCAPSSRKLLYWMAGPPRWWNLHCRHPLHRNQRRPPCPLRSHQLSRSISCRHHRADRFPRIRSSRRSKFANPRHRRHRPSDFLSPKRMANTTMIF